MRYIVAWMLGVPFSVIAVWYVARTRGLRPLDPEPARHDCARAGIGSRTTKVAPDPSPALRASIEPPCSSTR